MYNIVILPDASYGVSPQERAYGNGVLRGNVDLRGRNQRTEKTTEKDASVHNLYHSPVIIMIKSMQGEIGWAYGTHRGKL